MITAQPELLRVYAANILFHPPSFSRRRKSHTCLCSPHKVWIAQVLAPPPEVGPIELPASVSSFLAASDDPTLQTSAAILLTLAFTLFLFRSLRRRAKLAKQTRLRSTGTLKGEALESLRINSPPPIKRRKTPPSAEEALAGALIAAAFGLLLYKFTITVESNLNHQVLSNNYSVRQITITIRTIINGICYLATFVFGFNSIGLFLYSGQLALKYSSVDVRPTNESSQSKLPDAKEDQDSDK